ncbi:MAG: hypothetical protein JJT90_03695 [Ectothiorhodospiraceae bacterium]|nr:hypothetical protein [Ectothiorhodospiraceae bacterium]
MDLRIGQISHPQGSLQDVHVRLHQASGSGSLSIARAQWGEQHIGPLELQCERLRIAPAALGCAGATLALEHPAVGALQLQGEVQHAMGETRSTLEGTIGGNPARLGLHVHAEGASVQLQLRDMDAATLTPLIPDPGWHTRGQMDLSLSADLHRHGTVTGTLVLTVRDLDLSNPDGSLAAEGLEFTAIAGLRGNRREQRGTLRLVGRSGLAYVDPLLMDLDAHPVSLLANMLHRDGRLWLEQLRVRQPGLLQAHGQASLSWAPTPTLHRLSLRIDEAMLPEAYTTFLQPFLIGTVLDSLDMTGRLGGELEISGNRPLHAAMWLQQVDVHDRRERFSLNGLDGRLVWAEDTPVPPSRLRWQQGRIYRIALGTGEAEAGLAGDGLRLRRPLVLPVEDGALRLDTLRLDGLGGPDFAATLEGRLEPISLEALSRALGWPELQGTVSGTIPRVTYRDRRLALDDALQARIFDGRMNVDRFRIDDPLGRFPQLQADVRLRGLDLELITGTFAFGRITGRLNGDILGLELLGWEPVAFDARFHTPEGDRSTRRISQRAIENISDLGAGGTALLSGTALRFFEDFRYRQLGIRCVLEDNVCRMSGLRPEGDGYILVQGSGLPRVDVIGFTREVSWPTLLEQLRAVTQ